MTDKAVALSYERGSTQPPTVVAVGSGEVARRILDLALEHGVPVHEDGHLVAMLSRSEIGSEIPHEAMFAVARILAVLYRSKRLR